MNLKTQTSPIQT